MCNSPPPPATSCYTRLEPVSQMNQTYLYCTHILNFFKITEHGFFGCDVRATVGTYRRRRWRLHRGKNIGRGGRMQQPSYHDSVASQSSFDPSQTSQIWSDDEEYDPVRFYSCISCRIALFRVAYINPLCCHRSTPRQARCTVRRRQVPVHQPQCRHRH